jgi:hypothetical protein
MKFDIPEARDYGFEADKNRPAVFGKFGEPHSRRLSWVDAAIRRFRSEWAMDWGKFHG